MKKLYTYEIESVNMANGKPKKVQVYESPTQLKVGNIYFHLPGLKVGAYQVRKELENA